MRFRKACLAASILFSTVALGQHTSMPKNWDPNMTMTNEEVGQSVATGVPERFVVAKITSAKNVNFDTSQLDSRCSATRAFQILSLKP